MTRPAVFPVRSLICLRDHHRIPRRGAAAGADMTVRLWNIASVDHRQGFEVIDRRGLAVEMSRPETSPL